MEKIRITDKVKQVFINQKCRFERQKYPQIKDIFDITQSFSYEDCVYANKFYLEQYKQYSKYGSYIEGSYQDMLYKLANLIQAIKPNPTLEEILYIFSYIYRNGYLSLNNKFTFMYPEYELPIRNGTSLVTGYSVCRNIASMLSDLLYYFNISSFPILTDRLSKESDYYYLIEPFQELKENNDDNFEDAFYQKVNDNNLEVSLGNHCEVFVFNHPYYILDPTEISLSIINQKENEYAALDFIRPWSLFANGLYNLKFTINLYEFLKNKSLHIIRNQQIIDIQFTCYNLCEKNKKKILQFHQDIQSNITYLNNQLKPFITN